MDTQEKEVDQLMEYKMLIPNSNREIQDVTIQYFLWKVILFREKCAI